MRNTDTIEIGNRLINLRELTVTDIRGLLDRLEGQQVEADLLVIDLMYPDRMPAPAVAISMGITEKALAKRKVAPSEYEQILDAAEKLNPTFVALLERLAKVGRETQEKPSTGAAAS